MRLAHNVCSLGSCEGTLASGCEYGVTGLCLDACFTFFEAGSISTLASFFKWGKGGWLNDCP